MSYNITIESDFSAAHRLVGYRGKCETLHGHNWKVTVTVSSNMLDKTGMVFDFKKAKAILNGIIVLLDHKELNRITFFRKYNPTSELIAKYIFDKYNKKIRKPLTLRDVTVWETPTSSATFSGD